MAKTVKLICRYCHGEFELEQYRIANGQGTYCGRKCMIEGVRRIRADHAERQNAAIKLHNEWKETSIRRKKH